MYNGYGWRGHKLVVAKGTYIPPVAEKLSRESSQQKEEPVNNSSQTAPSTVPQPQYQPPPQPQLKSQPQLPQPQPQPHSQSPPQSQQPQS